MWDSSGSDCLYSGIYGIKVTTMGHKQSRSDTFTSRYLIQQQEKL